MPKLIDSVCEAKRGMCQICLILFATQNSAREQTDGNNQWRIKERNCIQNDGRPTNCGPLLKLLTNSTVCRQVGKS